MAYLWLKAIHVSAAVIWISGLLISALTLATTALGGNRPVTKERTAIVAAMRRWDRSVTAPAMILVWAVGLALATMGDWFPQRWLLIKLGVVLALSMLHGLLSGSLRKAAIGQGKRGANLGYAPWLVVLAMSTIVILVVLKPF
ncbi:hypothetical protein AA13595_0246 [Gluconacetobacter johannae DSM 13595]|uniref:Protoporphyrinogen IX oxidase n=1 Tax=Gluconacetobacter johannae TaxID=112140 RepID=A0A7W4J8C6_9PROT|nr:CopD family protein [Gluconacetobacter johannae]MBB2176572.1 hypothetical protein [Gluconacetobacter johannae]GBQ80143.1 hypothetical protein AA13595_0246 [Gluconacetobacter johannae DSM 13595]